MKKLIAELDACLPQTQCGECGFAGCLPYAEALAQGNTALDLCPPGGVDTIKSLAKLLNREEGQYSSAIKTRAPALAVIQEQECIGCTKCIQACPVDAIIGSAKMMHVVIADECTGCGLCVAPCPVDCIEMQTVPTASYQKEKARQRFNAKKIRMLKEEHLQQQLYREKKQLTSNSANCKDETQAKQDYIRQALARRQRNKRAD